MIPVRLEILISSILRVQLKVCQNVRSFPSCSSKSFPSGNPKIGSLTGFNFDMIAAWFAQYLYYRLQPLSAPNPAWQERPGETYGISLPQECPFFPLFKNIRIAFLHFSNRQDVWIFSFEIHPECALSTPHSLSWLFRVKGEKRGTCIPFNIVWSR